MEDVYLFLKKYLKKNQIKTVVSATSGGPDSMALLYMLSKLQKELSLHVICAHVNHNIRKESNEEVLFVEKFCMQNHITFEYMKIKEYKNDNFHNDAREKRYAYFEKIIKKYHAEILLTAHHADDLMETILMRIVRGSTLKGYSGFNKILDYKDYQIIRPFIEVTKDEILTYNKEHQIPFVIDSSNFKDVYTRNRFRKYILPLLKKEDPSVHQKFYKMSQTLLEYHLYIDHVLKEKIKNICPFSKINIDLYKKEDLLIQKELIRYILEQKYQENIGCITDKHTHLIREIILSSKANASISLPNQIRGIKAYHTFFLEESELVKKDFKQVLEDRTLLANGYCIEIGKDTFLNNNFICRLNMDEITMPLYVRNRKTADKMVVKGMQGHQKISQILIDNKIDKMKRDLYPIVTDAKDCILWVPGLKKSQFDKSKGEKYDIILTYYQLKGENDE